MNRMDESQFKKAKDFFSRLPQKHYIIWNDGPRVSKIYDELKEAQITQYIPGKGCNVWMAYGFIIAGNNKSISHPNITTLTWYILCNLGLF